MKRIAGIVLALFVMGFLTACGSGQAGLQDGYYTAQAAEYSHGWREYITIMVKDGSIVSGEGEIAALTGATSSYGSFQKLMAAVMDQAEKGDSSIVFVDTGH